MEIADYRHRVADDILSEYLKAFGAVCVEGPKWCGKTWTARRQSVSACMIADPTDQFATRRHVALDINYAFEGEEPHLIDEWQEFPELWDATRFHVDENSRKGRFILTGSSTPPEKGVVHTGTGRITSFRMRPMSLWESGASEGSVSLKDVCAGKDIGIVKVRRPGLDEICGQVMRGGWPGTLGLPFKYAVKTPSAYVRQIIDRDIHKIDGIRRDVRKVELLMRSLARNESTTASVATLRKDISASDGVDVDDETLSSYLNALRRLFVIEDQKPFAAGMRSPNRLKKMEKRHFCDPSIAAALLRATPEKLQEDLLTLGFLFESLVERDLRTYAEAFDGELLHYQDYDDREIDAVVELPSGEWAAFEVKLGMNQVDSAANGLLKMKERFADGGHPPCAMGVIVGLGDAAYRRPDGVYVIPITSLRP